MVTLSLGLAMAGPAHAQVVPGIGASIGTVRADRLRLAELRGTAPDSSTERVIAVAGTWSFTLVPGTLHFVFNSAIPAGGNDDALWAGRGANAYATGGVRATGFVLGQKIDFALAPGVAASQNRPFPLFPGRTPGWSAYSSPWHLADGPADLPLRFGDQGFVGVTPGQSALIVTSGPVAFGAAAGTEWWSPAIRNALVLSNNAEGVPRLFARTSRPVRSRFGAFEGRIILGMLTESPYFDAITTNDARALSGVLATFRPAFDTGLTIGATRLVMSALQGGHGFLGHSADALRPRSSIAPLPDSGGPGPAGLGADQMVSLFARWLFPRSGFETYAEWARQDLAPSPRRNQPTLPGSGAYTVGLQWADPTPAGRFVRLQLEASYLEQTTREIGPAPPDFYTGRAAVQGFTQRGQVLGAAIGPGASSQFLAADLVDHDWQVGLFAARTRMENDALYRQTGARLTQHDVTIQSGIRGAHRLGQADLAAELTVGRRMNYLFQNNYYLGNPLDATDVQNVTIGFTISPR